MAVLALGAWSLLVLAVAWLCWTRIVRHYKVYLLILLNAVYCVGVFALYALANGLPL